MDTIAPPDYMHSQLLGTAKLMIDCWLGKVNKVPKHLNASQLKIIDARLDSIKFPSQKCRKLPFLLSNKKWKAFDFENFLYYGSFSLAGILDPSLIYHFSQLARVLSLLNKRKILEAEIEEAERLIKEFIRNFNVIYPVEMHRFNVHLLLHLPDTVRRFGPLFVSSSFSVENEMGKMVRNVQTGTNVSQQVMSKALLKSSILTLLTSDEESFSPLVRQLANKVFDIKQHPDQCQFSLASNETLPQAERNLIPEPFQSFSKLKYKKLVLTTTFYSAGTQNSNNFIKTHQNSFFRIIRIAKISQNKPILICSKFNNVKITDFNYVWEAPLGGGTLEVVDIDDIDSNITIFLSDTKVYLFEIINDHI